MAVVVWNAAHAGPAAACRRASGVEVSVAVWREGTSYSLRFKRSADGGLTWPADEAATVIAAPPRREPWFVREVGGALLVGNGIDKLLRCTASGEDAADWMEVS